MVLWNQFQITEYWRFFPGANFSGFVPLNLTFFLIVAWNYNMSALILTILFSSAYEVFWIYIHIEITMTILHSILCFPLSASVPALSFWATETYHVFHCLKVQAMYKLMSIHHNIIKFFFINCVCSWVLHRWLTCRQKCTVIHFKDH